jgi:hypothetical protein
VCGATTTVIPRVKGLLTVKGNGIWPHPETLNTSIFHFPLISQFVWCVWFLGCKCPLWVCVCWPWVCVWLCVRRERVRTCVCVCVMSVCVCVWVSAWVWVCWLFWWKWPWKRWDVYDLNPFAKKIGRFYVM